VGFWLLISFQSNPFPERSKMNNKNKLVWWIIGAVSVAFAGVGIYGALATPERTDLILLGVIGLLVINVLVVTQGR
jgi:nitric oxide reductase large subunit